MSKRKSSIRTKLMAMLSAIIILPFIMVGVLVNNKANEAVHQQTDAGIKALTNSLVRETESRIDTVEGIIGTLEATPGMLSKNYVFQRELFTKVIKANPQIINLYIGFNDQPGLPSITPAQQLPADYDARKRPWYVKAISSDGIQITDVYNDASSGMPIISITKALRNNAGQVVGVLAADVSLSSLSEMVENNKLGEKGYAFIMDQKGVIIAHPNLDYVKKQSNFTKDVPMFAESLKNDQGLGTYTFEGEEKLASYQKVKSLGWVVFTQQPTEEAFSGIKAINGIIVMSTIVAIILALIGGLLYANSLTKRVRKIAGLVEEVADGNLTVQVNIETNDELGQLGQSFNKMLGQINGLIGRINDASQLVASSSEELTASAEQTSASVEQVAGTAGELAHGSVKQAKEVQEASRIINEMSGGIQQVAANANEVSLSSSRVAETAKDGVKEAENAVVTIQRVRETAQKTSNVIKVLGDESKEIGLIVDVIKGIADQTNLLALNAAIEAARAGEQGRGFAVVAEEVRKLAEQSSASAEQIATLIAKIQAETENAVQVMEVGTKEVSEGVLAVDKAGESFKIIVQEIDEVVSQVQQVSAATQQMAAGSSAVVHAINEIENIANQTAAATQQVASTTEEQTASMEEIASSAQNLAHLADELQKNINKFKYQ